MMAEQSLGLEVTSGGCHRRCRTQSFSSPFCADGADLDDPQFNNSDKDSDDDAQQSSLNHQKKNQKIQGVMLSRLALIRHFAPLILVILLAIFVLHSLFVKLFATRLGGQVLNPEHGHGRSEYREIKNPQEFQWSSKLVSLSEALKWFQTLPDLNLPMTGVQNLGDSRMTITFSEYVQAAERVRAQQEFNLGLRNLHAFSPFESLRHFSRCAEIDDSCPMCYWGLQMAMKWDAGYSVASQEAQLRMEELAAELRDILSKTERRLIKIALSFDETAACMELLQRHQTNYEAGQSTADHIEVDSFCAWQLVADSTNLFGKPLQPERETAQRSLKRLLQENPYHCGTHHYIIHAYEDTLEPEKASHSARLLGALAPGAAHFQHMPGHIFYLLGEYAEAAVAFHNSSILDEAYFRETGISPANNWNYIHNYAYAVANYIEAGRRREALAGANVLLELHIPKQNDPASSAVLQPVQFSPDTSRASGRYFYQAMLSKSFVYIRNEEWSKCVASFDYVMEKINSRFTFDYLGHLPKYYRALQLFCSGMEDIYSYVAASANLEIMTTPKLPVSNKQNQESDTTSQVRLQNKHFVNVPSSSLVGRMLRRYSRTEKSQTDALTEKKIQSLKNAKKCLNELIAIDTYLHTSTELDDNEGLAPPEVHVKNRAFFALGVHLLELQAVVKVVEGNYRRAAELFNQANSREQHILYNEPCTYPRPVLHSLGELDIYLYFLNGKVSLVYLERAIKTFTEIVNNPIHKRSGHALRPLVLSLLLKVDHLQDQQDILRSEDHGGSNDAIDESMTSKRRKRNIWQQNSNREEMSSLLLCAREYTSEFQYSWQLADVHLPGWSDNLDQLQNLITERLTQLDEQREKAKKLTAQSKISDNANKNKNKEK